MGVFGSPSGDEGRVLEDEVGGLGAPVFREDKDSLSLLNLTEGDPSVYLVKIHPYTSPVRKDINIAINDQWIVVDKDDIWLNKVIEFPKSLEIKSLLITGCLKLCQICNRLSAEHRMPLKAKVEQFYVLDGGHLAEEGISHLAVSSDLVGVGTTNKKAHYTLIIE